MVTGPGGGDQLVEVRFYVPGMGDEVEEGGEEGDGEGMLGVKKRCI